jgi:AAA family ATP:ADP antiporter
MSTPSFAASAMPTASPASVAATASVRDARPFDKGLLDRALGLLADVHAGEGATALLLALTVFLLLTAYYLLKTVREPLILASGSAELKSYAAALQAILLMGVVRGVAALGRRFGRISLVTITSVFFVSNLVVFHVLGRLGAHLGVPFYLWVGCFNVTVIAQFWSFVNDVYTPEQGKRLFAIVGLGASFGAIFGADLARRMVVPVGPFGMMLVAAALLLVSLAIFRQVHARLAGRERAAAHVADAPPGGTGGFALIWSDRYLLTVAAFVLVYNCVNSMGEYLLDRALVQSARSLVSDGKSNGLGLDQIIGVFKADYFFWVNAVGLAIQMFAVSRVFKHFGVRAALLILPVVAFAGSLAMAIAPVLMLVKTAKIAENSVDYSIQNTSRHTLFLPLSREAKFNAKAAIDTVVVRVGDALTAFVVWVGARLGAGARSFAVGDLVLVVVWAALAWSAGRIFQARSAAAQSATAAS